MPSTIRTPRGNFQAEIVVTLHRLELGRIDERFAFPRAFVAILIAVVIRLEADAVDRAPMISLAAFHLIAVLALLARRQREQIVRDAVVAIVGEGVTKAPSISRPLPS